MQRVPTEYGKNQAQEPLRIRMVTRSELSLDILKCIGELWKQ